MEVTFNYIRNKLRKHSKEDLLKYCYDYLDQNKNKVSPIWFIFLIMKWTYLFGGEKKIYQPLNSELFNQILRSVAKYNDQYINSFMDKGGAFRALTIVYSQQLYLQHTVYKEKFATQLKIFKGLESGYDIAKSFHNLSGIKIFDFIHMLQLSWLYTKLDEKELRVNNNYLIDDFLNIASEILDRKIVNAFLELLMLDPINPNEKINSFKRKLRKEELQAMERTFFTLYPFQYYQKGIRIIHPAILNYSINYYLYDYLKSNDERFTTEFGKRFERYVEFGLKEISCKYISESKLKLQLKENSKLVDYVVDSNIFIECKAIESNHYATVNPTDELIFKSLKDSVVKAYFHQLINVSKQINSNEENWGIIITYKELYWSQFSELYKIVAKEMKESFETTHLPPENVFIMDIHTWDKMIHIISETHMNIEEILILARKNNSHYESRKKLFSMHLEEFLKGPLNLSYLKPELEQLEIQN